MYISFSLGIYFLWVEKQQVPTYIYRPPNGKRSLISVAFTLVSKIKLTKKSRPVTYIQSVIVGLRRRYKYVYYYYSKPRVAQVALATLPVFRLSCLAFSSHFDATSSRCITVQALNIFRMTGHFNILYDFRENFLAHFMDSFPLMLTFWRNTYIPRPRDTG